MISDKKTPSFKKQFSFSLSQALQLRKKTDDLYRKKTSCLPPSWFKLRCPMVFRKQPLEFFRQKHIMNIKCSFLFYLPALYLNYSCMSVKEISYLGRQKEMTANNDGYVRSDGELYQLQRDDVLSVQIISKDPDLALFFGSQMSQGGTIGQLSEGSFYVHGLTVKSNGSIAIPIVGEVFVSGLNLEEARNSIEKALQLLYKKEAVFVKVQLSGIGYCVIGEVGKPGRYEVYKNRLSILEAIAQAGDLKTTADRKSIKLIRQYRKGKKIVSLDLTQASILNSPYYYLQPHDVLVINPRSEKVWGIGTDVFSSLSSILGTAAGIFGIVLSTLALSKN